MNDDRARAGDRARPGDGARAGDGARISVSVAVPPALAFEIFTIDIDRWWRRGPTFRHSGSHSGLLCIEPAVGGRLFESFDADGTRKIIEVGRVSVWDPPHRLKFSWRNANFTPDEQTEVQVEFAPNAQGTLVTVTHAGIAQLRADHPARHGLHGADVSRMFGLWWGEQMSSLRRLCAQRSNP